LHSEKLRILLVNDDERVCDVLGIILESRGYEVDVAHTRDEAIEKSKTNAYNLAVLDNLLPDIESKNLLKGIHESSPKKMRIVDTEIVRLQDALDASNDCADRYFANPEEPSRLINLIEEKLEEQRDAKIARGKEPRTQVRNKTKKLS
jgi:DNA-binding NtrC family response regulator